MFFQKSLKQYAIQSKVLHIDHSLGRKGCPMPRNNFTALNYDRSTTKRADRSLARRSRRNFIFSDNKGVSHNVRLMPEKEKVFYISLLCDLYREAQTRKHKINLLRDLRSLEAKISSQN